MYHLRKAYLNKRSRNHTLNVHIARDENTVERLLGTCVSTMKKGCGLELTQLKRLLVTNDANNLDSEIDYFERMGHNLSSFTFTLIVHPSYLFKLILTPNQVCPLSRMP